MTSRTNFSIAFSAVLSLATGAAWAQPATPAALATIPESPEWKITSPDWKSLPSAVALHAALQAHSNELGRVTVRCTIGSWGSLKSCKVIESPQGKEVAAAGLELSGEFQVQRVTPEGRATKGATIETSIWVLPLGWAEVIPPGAVTTGAKASEPLWGPLIATRLPKEYEATYPERAFRKGKVGRVELHCIAGPDGILTACTAKQEEPVGWGFAEAAVKLSSMYRVPPPTPDRKSVDGYRVVIPISFIWSTPARPLRLPPSTY